MKGSRTSASDYAGNQIVVKYEFVSSGFLPKDSVESRRKVKIWAKKMEACFLVPSHSPCGCRVFESRHANKAKAPHLVRYGAFALRVDDGIRKFYCVVKVYE